MRFFLESFGCSRLLEPLNSRGAHVYVKLVVKQNYVPLHELRVQLTPIQKTLKVSLGSAHVYKYDISTRRRLIFVQSSNHTFLAFCCERMLCGVQALAMMVTSKCCLLETSKLGLSVNLGSRKLM